MTTVGVLVESARRLEGLALRNAVQATPRGPLYDYFVGRRDVYRQSARILRREASFLS